MVYQMLELCLGRGPHEDATRFIATVAHSGFGPEYWRVGTRAGTEGNLSFVGFCMLGHVWWPCILNIVSIMRRHVSSEDLDGRRAVALVVDLANSPRATRRHVPVPNIQVLGT